MCLADLSFQIDEVLEEGVGALNNKVPVLLVLNKKDLIKPGEIAKRLEVSILQGLYWFYWKFKLSSFFSLLPLYFF